MNNGTGMNRILISAVALLAVAMGIQTVALFRLRERIDRGPTQNAARLTPQVPAKSAVSAARTDDEPSDVFSPVPAGLTSAHTTDPFAEMEQMRRAMDQLFEQSLSRMPRISVYDNAGGLALNGIDIRDEGDHYIATVDVPGMKEGALQIGVENGQLNISGTTGGRVEKHSGGRISQEFRSGRFSQSITLPGPVDETKIRSRLDEGTLTITLPKKPDSPPAAASATAKTSV